MSRIRYHVHLELYHVFRGGEDETIARGHQFHPTIALDHPRYKGEMARPDVEVFIDLDMPKHREENGGSKLQTRALVQADTMVTLEAVCVMPTNIDVCVVERR